MPPTASPPSALRVATTTFCLAVALFLALFAFCPLLYDADAYYHLAIARIVDQRGFVRELPELRWSVLGTDFGDKEALFHVLLIPAARFGEAGGRVALALLIGLVFASIAGLARRAAGWWAVLVPFALFATALDFSWRLVRLRPELLSLVLLLALIAAAAGRRARLAGLVLAVYTWSYTAFHAALGLAGFFSVESLRPRLRIDWRLLAYATLGCGLALVLHPQFPANLQVWAVQNISHFAIGEPLDFGREMEPHAARDILLLNLGWFAAMAALWRARRAAPAATDSPTTRPLAIAAAVFLALYLGASRFGFYFYPFATLWLLARSTAGGGLGGRVRLWGARTVPLAAALAAAAILGAPELLAQGRLFVRRTVPGPHAERTLDREAFARAMPADARVAAPWRSTALYLFIAPQGRYLNVLDPVFMALPYPDAYRAQRDIFTGIEPDVPASLVGRLGSDYLAFSLVTESAALPARLAADPRIEALYRGIQGLYRVLPDRNGDFLLDWRSVPEGEDGRGLTASGLAAQPTYPRLVGPAAAVEGFVDLGRAGWARVHLGIDADACARVARPLTAAGGRFEFAPYDRGRVFLGGRSVATVERTQGAVLGAGIVFDVPAEPSARVLVVESCGDARSPRFGFYLRALPAASSDGGTVGR